MVVLDGDIRGLGVTPGKNDTKLPIDSNRKVAASISPERLQSVSGGDTKVFESDGVVKIEELTACNTSKLRRELPRLASVFVIVQVSSELVPEARYHVSII